jgi:quinoprotein glucose dehydrogenase
LRATLLLHLAVFCLVYGQIRPGTITGSVNDGTGSANYRNSGTPGGPIATGGGVLFIGATIDARFRALDARTGKELWTTKLVDAAKATPITYQGKNGKQYVAILAGGGETRGPENPGGRLYVFALP